MSERRLAADYKVGWICATYRELAAAIAMLDERHQRLAPASPDSNTYTLGRIGGHNVALGCLPDGVIGTTSAATVASQMRLSFPSIRFGLMVGIGGGVPTEERDIRLGDVVVSRPKAGHGGVVQYDFGQTLPDRFVHRGFLNAPPTVLLTAISHLRAESYSSDDRLARNLEAIDPSVKHKFAYPGAQYDRLFEAEYNHPVGGGDTCEKCDTNRLIKREPRGSNYPVVHYGTIASANQIMKDGVTRDRLSAKFDGILCFEMEAAGLMNNFPCVVIRGVSDYADAHKSGRWRNYAALTAAAYAKQLLNTIAADEVVSTPPVLASMPAPGLAASSLSMSNAEVQIPNGDYDQAIQTYQEAIERDPMNYWVWYNICRIYLARNDLDGAINMCNLGLEKISINPSPLIQLINLYAAKGDYKNAIMTSMKLLSVNMGILRLAVVDSEDTLAPQARAKSEFERIQLRLQKERAFIKSWSSANTTFAPGETQTTLYLAAWTGDVESLKIRVRQGEDICRSDSYGWTALHLAVWNMHADAARFLLSVAPQKTLVSRLNQDNVSALHLAAWNNDIESMKELLKAGGHRLARDKDGLTPMIWAAKNGHSEAIKLLKNSCVGGIAQETDDLTPMLWSIYRNVDAFKALAAADIEFSALDKDGLTLMLRAAKHGHVIAIKMLKKDGVNVSMRDKDGLTPIHWAAKNGHVSAITELREAGADVCAQDKTGRTPAHFAAKNGHTDAIKALNEAGADFLVKDKYGRRPLHLAISMKQVEAIVALKEISKEVKPIKI